MYMLEISMCNGHGYRIPNVIVGEKHKDVFVIVGRCYHGYEISYMGQNEAVT